MKYLAISLGLLLALLVVSKELKFKWYYNWQQVIITDSKKFCVDKDGVQKLSFDAYHIELYCNDSTRYLDKADMTTYRFMGGR